MIVKFISRFMLFFAVVFAASQAFAYDKMIVFGDSLSDNGNFFYHVSDKHIPETPPYFQGRFSNGPVWVELLAQRLQLDTNSTKQFQDYALALTWAADAGPDGSGGLFSLSYQVADQYLKEEKPQPDAIKNNLFVIWIGSNDYLQEHPRDSDPNHSAEMETTKAINDIRDNIKLLIDHGAHHFLLLNLPNLGLTPSAIGGGETLSKRLTLLSSMHNQKQEKMLNALHVAYPDVEFIQFDLSWYFADLLKNPAKYDINNVSDPCDPAGYGKASPPPVAAPMYVTINGQPYDLQQYIATRGSHMNLLTTEEKSCLDDTQKQRKYLFWDYIHPTAIAHQWIAEFVYNALPKHQLVSRN